MNLLRLLIRWVVRGAILLIAAFALLYLGDWAVFALRGAPRATVPVHHTLVIPLKGGKQEYDDQGTVAQSCAVSLFAQNGLDACWKLRRNPNQNIAY